MSVVVAGVALGAGAGPALAAPPSNDDISQATVIGALPFHAEESTVEATFAPGEQQTCLAGGHSVWFSYTPASSGSVQVDASGSSFYPVLAVFAGLPSDSNFAITCRDPFDDDPPIVRFLGLAGNTYYIELASMFDGPGGDVTLDVAPSPPPATATVTLGRKVVADRFGRLSFGGTIVCSRSVPVQIQVFVREKVKHFLATGEATLGGPAPCPTTRTRWSALVGFGSGPAFHAGGVASFDLSVEGGDAFDNIFVEHILERNVHGG